MQFKRGSIVVVPGDNNGNKPGWGTVTFFQEVPGDVFLSIQEHGYRFYKFSEIEALQNQKNSVKQAYTTNTQPQTYRRD